MRRLRYSVAASLDGFIAGPNGEFDWIPMDPDIDFVAIFARYDTLVLGRKTFEASTTDPDGTTMWQGKRVIVCSRTLDTVAAVPGAELWRDDIPTRLTHLKQEPGKDLWLFGGGDLFAQLLDAGVVDEVEVAIVPVLLGGGIPLRALPSSMQRLTLQLHRVYEKSGIILLTYQVPSASRGQSP